MKPSRLWFLQLAIAGVLLVICCLSAMAQQTTIPPRVTEAVDVNKLVTLRGNTHPLARPEFDRGAASDSQPIRRMLLVLQRSPGQQAELRRLLDEQQVKSSPNFHRWLTPGEFGQRFGPADADIQAVTDWLASQGFEVSRVAAGHTVIEFSGTAGQVGRAFHTEIHKYAVNGEEHAEAWANASDPQIPAALASVVKGFASLNNFPRTPMIRPLGTFRRSKATGEVRPLFTFRCSPVSATCSTVWGRSTLYGLGPTDFATIYNLLPLWNAGTDGLGQTIAIVGETNINPQDVADFRSMFGLPANSPNIILDGPDPGVLPDEEAEGDLDVQWAGAVAQGATVDFVVSQTTEASAGIDLSALYIVDNNLAPVMSESYGACELFLGDGGNAFYNSLWEQASAQGITVMISAGDSGSAGCDPHPSTAIAASYGAMVNGIASTPFNVAVGGTDFNDANALSTYWNPGNVPLSQSSALSYIPETTWNDTCASAGPPSQCFSPASDGRDLVAGSGGPSTVYSKPSWQGGFGVPSDLVRDLPDLSLFAGDGLNASFYVICQMDASGNAGGSTSSCDLNSPFLDFLGAGGTSASSPAFAGIMALVNQKYGRQGNANYVLYKLAAQSGASCNSDSSAVSNSSCIFYDVNDTLATSGNNSNNSVACVGGTANCSNPAAGGYGILVANPSATTLTAAWTTTAGYDLATGLGSVNAANLVNNWTQANFTSSTTTLSLSTTPATSPLTLKHGQPLNVNITVAPTAPLVGPAAPTGDVSLLAQTSNSQGNSPTTAAGMFPLSSGSASGTSNLLPAGTYDVTAHYAGDGTFGASDSSPLQVTVSKENSQPQLGLVTFDLDTGRITSSNATSATYGSPYFLRANILNGSSNPCAPNGIAQFSCPTGTVTLTANRAPLDQGAYPLNSQGYAEDQTIQLPVGSYTVAARYSGDSSYNPSNQTVALTITQAATTTVPQVPSSIVAGQTYTLTVYVNTQSLGVAPTGSVTVFGGATALASAVPCTGTPGSSVSFAYCVALPTLSLSSTTALSVQYSGDDNYAGSTWGPFTTSVIYPTATTLTASAQTVTTGANVVLTAVVDGQQTPAPTGPVTFLADGVQLSGTVATQSVTDAHGFPALQVALTFAPTASANYVWATYSGDSNYAPSQSKSLSLTLTDFSLSPDGSNLTIASPGQSGTLAITVSPTNGFTGTVGFTCSISPKLLEGNCSLSPASLVSSGSTTLTVTTSAPSTTAPFLGPRWLITVGALALLCAFLILSILLRFLPIPCNPSGDGYPASSSPRRRRLILALAALSVALLTGVIVGCGGGTRPLNPGTPAGNYTVTVTATSGALAHTVTENLVVQ